MTKYTCRQCNEEKDEKNDMQHTLLKEDSTGWIVLFTPLCGDCFREIVSKPLKELFPIEGFDK